MATRYVYELEYRTEGGERRIAISVPMERKTCQRAANEMAKLGYPTKVRALEPEKENTRNKKHKSGAKVIAGSLHTEED